MTNFIQEWIDSLSSKDKGIICFLAGVPMEFAWDEKTKSMRLMTKVPVAFFQSADGRLTIAQLGSGE